MSNFYNTNISLLKQFHPHIWTSIINLSSEPYGEIIKATNGKLNLKINNKGQELYLHAEHDPTVEIPQFLNLVPENSTEIVVLMGMGLGYTPLALIEQRPDISYLIIFELIPQIFNQALHSLDLSPLLSDPRLILSVSPQPDIAQIFAPAHQAIQYESVNFLKHLPSLTLKEKEYNILDEKIYSFTNEINSVGFTKKIYGRKILENRFNNLTPIRHHYLLENLKNLYANIPAFIVAAGPSLDKNIHFLKKIQNRAIIISVDSSLPSLLFHGIEPHFITVIDFSPFTYEKIATSINKVKNVSLIYTPAVGYKSPKAFPAKAFFCASSDKPLEKWLYSQLGSKESVADIATVAHLNLASAITMGCDPIIFVGQDLSYPPVTNPNDYVDHAQHCYFGDSTTLNTKKNSLLVKGIDGSMRPTLRDFHAYIKIFERTMAATPRHYINSTAEGANLVGTEILSLEKAVQRYCTKRHNINDIFNKRLAKTPHPATDILLATFKRTLGQLRGLKKTIRKFISLAPKFSKNIAQLSQKKTKPTSFPELPTSLQKKAIILDTLRDEIDHATFFWQLLDELTMKHFSQNAKKMRIITSLQDNPQKYTELLLINSEFILYTTKIRQKALKTFETMISQTMDHLRTEKKLTKNLKSGRNCAKNLLQLAKLYFSTHDLVLAKPLFEKLYKMTPGDAEVYFFLGCIAAQQTDNHRAELLFANAEKLDKSIKSRIDSFRKQYADEYWDIAEKFKKEVGRSFKKILFRGIYHCPNHTKILTELITLADQDLQTIEEELANGNHDKVETLVSEWVIGLKENKDLSYCLTPRRSAAFYLLNGNRLILKKYFKEAEQNFQTALLLTPDNPKIHIAQVNLCFMNNDFAGGISALHRAIELNGKYAVFWQDIGESLQQAEQYNEAIYAYEQTFLAFPDKIELLKKIGDCYLADDQLDAAKEAYEQLKSKLGAL